MFPHREHLRQLLRESANTARSMRETEPCEQVRRYLSAHVAAIEAQLDQLAELRDDQIFRPLKALRGEA